MHSLMRIATLPQGGVAPGNRRHAVRVEVAA